MTRAISIGAILLAYVLAARACWHIHRPGWRAWAFAAVNLVAYIALAVFFAGGETELALVLCGAYVLLIVVSFAVMAAVSHRIDWVAWVGFFFPILPLVLMKYLPFEWTGALPQVHIPKQMLDVTIVGLSYMAFRLSHLVLEVRNGLVVRPSLAEYLGFAFFLPTMMVGPINPYSVHQHSFAKPDLLAMPVGRCLLRILVGGVKCEFLGNLANQISYAGLFLDGKPHRVIDLAVAMVSYYLYLYWNFSGFCDIAIGVAGLIGIRVKENFNNPFAAKSIREYWNRWHITLSEYVRDVIFSPVSKLLVRRLGSARANWAISMGILAAFFVVGLWHGAERRYVIWGLLQAAGLIIHHNYTVWLKRRLGPEGYRRYHDNRWIGVAGQLLTFGFVLGSLFVFANDNYVLGSALHSLGYDFWRR